MESRWTADCLVVMHGRPYRMSSRTLVRMGMRSTQLATQYGVVHADYLKTSDPSSLVQLTKQLADARREHRSEEPVERRVRKEANRHIVHDVDERRALVRTLLELSLHRSKDDVQYIIF